MTPPIHRYELPLDILVGDLQDLRATGILQTQIPYVAVQGKQIKEACQVEVVLENGSILQCTIFQKRGVPLLQGEGAWYALKQFAASKLVWQFAPGVESDKLVEASLAGGAFPPVSQAARYEKVPRRLATASLWPQEQLPRDLRRILLLVDGRRSLRQIAELLALSLEGTHGALRQLHAWKLVVYEE